MVVNEIEGLDVCRSTQRRNSFSRRVVAERVSLSFRVLISLNTIEYILMFKREELPRTGSLPDQEMLVVPRSPVG